MKAPYAEKVLISPPTTGLAESQSPRDAQKRADAARAPRWGPKANILEAVETAGDFKILGQALRDAHLDDILSGKGPFTLFAPTDEAFAKMPSADLHTMLADPVRLRCVLSHHIVASKIRAPRERMPNTTIAVDGRKLTMTVRQGSYKVNEAQIVKTNLRASNGVIHAIDSILLPA
jgi:uncharacterized surface protein with fasciclin (FAS1) repeats